MNVRRKVKVLHVVGGMNSAGTETMLMNVYRHIDRDIYRFDFISYQQEDAYYDEEIHRLNGRIIKLSKTNSLKQLIEAIKKYGPYDVIHAHTLFHCGLAVFAAYLAGVKIRISHAHTTQDKPKNFIRLSYMYMMRLFILIFSTHLLACSREAGNFLYGKKHTKRATYHFFPNSIDYQKFIDVPKREVETFKKEEALENQLVIGHIGTFKESKNQMFLLHILKCLQKKNIATRLLLVGDGELREKIEELAVKEGVKDDILFCGIREDIPTMLHSMDVFVFPSIYEGLGLVLLEAQASGVPCVVSEAIQAEADLGLNLLKKLSLRDGPERWAEQIIALAGKKEKNKQRIIESFEKNGYSVRNGIHFLQQLYDV